MGSELALVVGMGRSGEAVAGHLLAHGWRVIAVDDAPGAAGRERARALGVELVEHPGVDELRRLVESADLVAPSPGVPVRHPVFRAAAEQDVPVLGEIELAWRDLDRPVVAVTGTNGKTTVTTLIARMLVESGVAAIAAGNIGLPLSSAVGRDVDVVVAEVSSFQLQFVDGFRPRVAVWLNLAADHLDWHPDVDAYVAAKARVWERQGPDDVAVVNADDPVVMAASASAPGRVVTFGLCRPADWMVVDGSLAGPDGPLLGVAALPRAQPHDVANGLAAAAAASAMGATVAGMRAALVGFEGLPHRLELVASAGGVDWYDDSKATNPHAAAAAVAGFESVVLIAGGRNKGLDLGALAAGAARIRSVVAIGEAAGEVAAAFDGLRPVHTAGSMDEAVRLAAAAAVPGDAVLL
ncbi:MAG TPA: UDP-N-acetylmuramoyl-L-alanine--D-glutamate ligase, partial [Acidimicrobiales bacterium]